MVGDLLRGLASLSHGRLGSAKRFHACDEGYWADFSVGRRPPKYKLSPPSGNKKSAGAFVPRRFFFIFGFSLLVTQIFPPPIFEC